MVTQNDNDKNPKVRLSQPIIGGQSKRKGYEIHIRGHLNPSWADWLEGLQIDWRENGETVLSGTLVDQAALMGVLNKLNGLNIAILSVKAYLEN